MVKKSPRHKKRERTKEQKKSSESLEHDCSGGVGGKDIHHRDMRMFCCFYWKQRNYNVKRGFKERVNERAPLEAL